MAVLALTDLLPGTTQTTSVISIPKTALNLTSENVDADKFVAAVAIKVKELMTQAQFDAEYEQNVYASDGFDGFSTKNNGTEDISFLVRQIVINLGKPDEATLNPEDY
ncbi:MAG: hypothetical protein F6K62_24710 [Sphaerospermopsis sp. SIO1G2]|nr:hypothetical protein [Sphaerospermopsis sp. SIO1G2]